MLAGAGDAHADGFKIGTSVGNASRDVIVDGTTMVAAWTEGEQTVGFCPLPRGGTACSPGLKLARARAVNERVFVIEDAATGKVRILTFGSCGSTTETQGTIWQWTYDPTTQTVADEDPQAAGINPKLIFSRRPVDLFAGEVADHNGEVIIPTRGSAAIAARYHGSDAKSTTAVTLPHGADSTDSFVTETIDGGLLYAAQTPGDNALVWRLPAGADAREAASWAKLASVPGAVTGLDHQAGRESNTRGFRRFNGTDFDPLVAPSAGSFYKMAVGAGAPHATYLDGDDLGVEQLPTASNQATKQLVVTGPNDAGTAKFALADDGRGFLLYDSSVAQYSATGTDISVVEFTDPVAAGLTGPTVGTYDGPTQSYGAPVGHNGSTFDIIAPQNCLSAGQRFKVSFGYRRGTDRRRVTVRKVVVSIDGQRVATIRRRPFGRLLTIANPVSGMSYAIKAKATLKAGRRHARTVRVSVTQNVTVCA